MKKSLIVCLLAALTIQADDATPAERNIKISKAAEKQADPTTVEDVPSSKEVIAQLKKEDDLRKTRGIDFGAYNNFNDYEKYHEDTEDAEDAEGEQE